MQISAGTLTRITALIIGVLLVPLLAGEQTASSVPSKQDGTVKIRGLFACAPGFCENAEHLRDVIGDKKPPQFGTNWASPPVVLESPTVAELEEAITGTDSRPSAFDGSDQDDVVVLWVGGHGKRGEVGTGDEIRDTWIWLDTPGTGSEFLLVDDKLGSNGDIGQALANIQGTKVLVFQACYSGGMIDGPDDPPIANSIVISSNTADQVSNASLGLVFMHRHSYFTGSLVSGFLSSDPFSGKRDHPRDGVVAADPNPDDGNSSGSIKFQEWFDFGKDEVAALLSLEAKNLGNPHAETPQIDDSEAPNGRKATDLTIFEYMRNTISTHLHQDPPLEETATAECESVGEVPPPETSGSGGSGLTVVGIASLLIIVTGVVLIFTGLYLSVADWRRKNPKSDLVLEGADQLGGLAKLVQALTDYPLGMQLVFAGIAVLIVGGSIGGIGALVSGL